MKDPVAVANFRTRLDAEVASGMLAAHGIPCVIQTGEGMMYGPLPAGTTILVRSQDAAAARRLLEDEAENEAADA